MPWYLYFAHFIFLCVCIFVDSVVVSRTLPPVHWYSSNSVFKTSNNDHVIDVNMNDDIDFFCPHYPNGTDPDTHEYYIIYRVSKDAYDSCSIDPEDRLRLAIVNCSLPSEEKRVTLSIISFSPIPNTAEFREGETYYFITTSGGRAHEINNEQHGACYFKNMKLSLKVCCQSTTTSTTTPRITTTNHTRAPPISTTRHPNIPPLLYTTTTPNTNTDSKTSTSIHNTASTTTVAASPSTTTTTTSTRTSTRRRWRSTSTTNRPRETSTTTKRSGDNDSDQNEVLPKAGSHVNSAISVYSRTAHTLYLVYTLTTLCLLTRSLIWLTTR